MRAYLDHAATTPMIPAAVEALTRELSRTGNASSLHGSGRAARRVVEESREAIAGCLGARPSEVVLTSGGTEADNLAVKGGFWARPDRNALVVSAVEHHAVLDPAAWLATGGADLRIVPVDRTGLVEVGELAALLGVDVALVSVQWANNEVGTLQPVDAVVGLAHEVGALAHSDAVQAVGHVPVDFAASGLDVLSLTAHKLGGPYGVGALLARREVGLTPVLHGGGQERDVRSGTLDPPAIAGFAAAVVEADRRRHAEDVRLRELRADLTAVVRAADPSAEVNSPEAVSLPGILSVTFPGCEADAILLLLDAAGVDCATGSACSAGLAQPSHVLLAMGRDVAQARSTIRFSLGHSSTSADVAAVAAALPEAIARARSAGTLAPPSGKYALR